MSGLFVIPEGAQIAPKFVTEEAESSLRTEDSFAGLRITTCFREPLLSDLDQITWLIDVEEMPDFTMGDVRRLADVFSRCHRPAVLEVSYVPTSKTIVIVEWIEQ